MGLLWDALKVEIREITMTFSKIKPKKNKGANENFRKDIRS